jgi:hypothetical protein
MNYTLNQKDNGITELVIPTDSQWGTICFAWEDSNQEFVNAMNSKGLELFVDLLVNDPNTAYNQFING